MEEIKTGIRREVFFSLAAPIARKESAADDFSMAAQKLAASSAMVQAGNTSTRAGANHRAKVQRYVYW